MSHLPSALVLSSLPSFWLRIRRAARRIERALLFPPLRALYNASDIWRRNYWERRAPDLDARWGKNTGDFAMLGEMLRALQPARLLDFGCGSGRLFPLYLQLGIPEIVGHDISAKALDICRARYSAESIRLTDAPLSEILRADQAPFDAIICNQVLQHVPAEHIAGPLAQLAALGNALYINDAAEAALSRRFFFMYRHDYDVLLRPHGFVVTKSGADDQQRWQLFVRQPSA